MTTTPPSAITATSVVPPPMSTTGANRRGHRLFDEEGGACAGVEGGVVDGALLHFRDAGRDADGGSRAYSATDNLVVPEATGLPPGEVIRAVADAGLHIDHRTGTGVVLHMLSGLAVDGRFGLTAIAHTSDEAVEMQEATRVAVERLAASSASARSRVEG